MRKYNAILSEYRRKFFDKYNNELKEILDVYENCRIDALEKLKKDVKNKILYLIILPVIIVIITFLCAFYLYLNTLIAAIIIAFSGILAGYNLLDTVTLVLQENKLFKRLLKKNLVNQIIGIFEGNIERFSKAVIPSADIPDSRLFSGISGKIDFDDNFVGSYKNVDFLVSEAVLYSNILEIPTYKGVLIKFKFNKSIKNQTVVISKKEKFGHYLMLAIIAVVFFISGYTVITKGMDLGRLGGDLLILCIYIIWEFCYMINNYIRFEKLKPMSLEDIWFDKKYKAYSSDQIEGRYLVTTAFMERFQNLKTAFHSKDIRCSFYEDTLMIAVGTYKNLFEVGNIFKPLNTPKYIEEYFNQISSILEMVDYFKLDEKTGL